MTPASVCCIVLLSTAAVSAGADSPTAKSPTAVPVDGQPFPAKLTAVDAKWQLGFTSGPRQRTLPAAELVQWGACAEPRRGPVLVAADGGLLVADVYRIERGSLAADSRLFGALRLPIESLAGVIFDLPSARRGRDLLPDRLARAEGDSDHLLLHNGDRLTGLLEQIKDDVVHFQTDGVPIQIETHRVAAVVFNPALRRTPQLQGLRTWAGFRDGSRLIATGLVIDKSSLQITTAAGQTLPEGPAGELVWLQPLGSRATYLSDLKAVEYRHEPFLSLQWPYRTDRSVTGGLLRGGGRLYLKGLGMHTAARLTYALGRQYTRFQAELAVDDSTAGGGSVRYRVFVDGRRKYTSETVRGGAQPVPVAVDLTDAQRLDLFVDYAERADELDHANWLNARLIK